MSISVNGKAVVFPNEYNGKKYYMAGLTKKDMEGKYRYGSMPIRFRKGVVFDEMTRIDITSGWLSFYKKENSDGKKHTNVFIFVSEFVVSESADTSSQGQPDQQKTIDMPNFEELEEEVPF